ncbi:hypothetical protein NPIL_190631 [Nephila pilipes]|uniref:Uncharacterized protein n=1 Tax=Nephila pilipes TaxID=299642 RepID=A0A8X6QFN9_NEPPI|nr:hypothetical protein NPIL_83811 [Nephila pilipes]GFU16329.1 hypothetical protein NPIL_190631 [Nephila pilipes]
MSIDDGEHGYMPVPCLVSKKFASDFSTSSLMKHLGKNVHVYGHESPLADEDLHVGSKEETDDYSVRTEALLELLSIVFGNENVTQRY